MQLLQLKKHAVNETNVEMKLLIYFFLFTFIRSLQKLREKHDR